MFVRHSCAAGDQLPAGTVAVAVGDRAVRVVVVVRHWRHHAFVPVVGEEIVTVPTYCFVVTRIDSSEK